MVCVTVTMQQTTCDLSDVRREPFHNVPWLRGPVRGAGLDTPAVRLPAELVGGLVWRVQHGFTCVFGVWWGQRGGWVSLGPSADPGLMHSLATVIDNTILYTWKLLRT